MELTEEIKLPLTSQDVTEERINGLRELFPEAFAEGRVDFKRLKEALSEMVDEGPERYGLSWAGRSEAMRAIRSLSTGTLMPAPEESVNFQTTGNMIIEGDNLEVLKLLQKSYHGKVKMIYIDPPYNTGKEFIYPDNFREGLQEYLRFSGQVSGEGIRLTTNAETEGRFHSKWLSMMYPRLFLAKNLLRDDGLIFVSIDDNELHNLRMLMNEIFGENNFVDCIIWKKRYGGGAKEKYLVTLHEYILFYAKNKESLDALFIPNDEEAIERYYKSRDEKYETRGPYRTHPLEAGKNMDERKNLIFPIPAPDGSEIWPRRQWLWGKERAMKALQENELEFAQGKEGWTVQTKQYLRDEEGNVRQSKAFSVIDTVYTQHGTNETIDIFGNAKIFSYPKPTGLIKPLIQLATSVEGGDIVLDFFSGSGTTAHAVLDINREDGGNRRFIMSQLPEPTAADSDARAAGFKTLSEIGRERVRRVIERMNEREKGKLPVDEIAPDRGFKAFNLTSSNFKIWDADNAPKDADVLADQLRLYADHVVSGRSETDILYEILLKAGLPLTAKIEAKELAGQRVYAIADGLLLICLADPITQETLRGIISLQPSRVICLDLAFRGNDQLKTNIVLEMKSQGIEFRAV
jgi:adenine-specific DNA-methyltransferase